MEWHEGEREPIRTFSASPSGSGSPGCVVGLGSEGLSERFLIEEAAKGISVGCGWAAGPDSGVCLCGQVQDEGHSLRGAQNNSRRPLPGPQGQHTELRCSGLWSTMPGN